jgi:hypothetical protein
MDNILIYVWNAGGDAVADPGFQVRRGGAHLETFWGISCEKSRFYAKKSYFVQLRREARQFLWYFVWNITIVICSLYDIGIIMFFMNLSSLYDIGIKGLSSIVRYLTSQGCTLGAPPPLKLEKILFFSTKSWFFKRNTPKIFAPPSAIGKNIIFWRKIVIFHTKYPQNFRASLRSAQFF